MAVLIWPICSVGPQGAADRVPLTTCEARKRSVKNIHAEAEGSESSVNFHGHSIPSFHDAVCVYLWGGTSVRRRGSVPSQRHSGPARVLSKAASSPDSKLRA